MAWLMAAITTVTPVHTDPAAQGGGAWAPGGLWMHYMGGGRPRTN